MRWFRPFLTATAIAAGSAAAQTQGDSVAVPSERTVVWTTREHFESASADPSGRVNLDLDRSPGDVRLRKTAATGSVAGVVSPVADNLVPGSEVAVAGNAGRNEYLAVWEAFGERGSDIAGRLIGPGGAPLGRLLSIAAGPAREYTPQVAFDQSRRQYLVVHGAFDGRCMFVGRLLGEDGAPAGRETILAGCDSRTAGLVLAAVPGGGFLALWTDRGGTGEEVRLRAIGPDGRPAGDIAVLSAASGFRRHPRLAYGARLKEFLVVWEDWRSGGAEIRARRVAPDGTPRGAEFPVTDSGGGKGHPTVAWIGASDRFFVAWEDQRDAPEPSRGGNIALLIQEQRTARQGADVYGRTLPAAGGIDGPEFLVISRPFHQRRPSADYEAATDQVVLLWEDGRRTYENWDIAGVVLEEDGSWGADQMVIDGAPDEQMTPVLVSNGKGRFLALWQGVGPDYLRAGIYARGIGLQNGATGIFAARVDSGQRRPLWGRVAWSGTSPAGTRIRCRVRSAALEGSLESASWSDFHEGSDFSLTGARERWLEVEARLESLDGRESPVLHDLSVSYRPAQGDPLLP